MTKESGKEVSVHLGKICAETRNSSKKISDRTSKMLKKKIQSAITQINDKTRDRFVALKKKNTD